MPRTWNRLASIVRIFGVPIILLGVFLVLAASLVRSRSRSGEDYDEAALHEWIEEARVFRATLPELVRRYVETASGGSGDRSAVTAQELELHDQLVALADPTRMYSSQLPLFPTIYRLELQFEAGAKSLPAIIWESQVPRPRDSGLVSRLTHPILESSDAKAVLNVEYQLHAYNKRQRDEQAAALRLRWLSALALTATALTFLWLYWVRHSEKAREERRLSIQRQADEAEKLALSTELRRQEAERQHVETQRKLLEQQLATQAAQGQALELQSQLYASVGIMAGSYAHNIKNLLVRPNDLLRRCLDSNGLSSEQHHMLGEVRQTLGTVTERLEQILHTVRRDPSRPEMSLIDLNDLVREVETAWHAIATDKWKVSLSLKLASGALEIQGDHSHLLQAIENLLFNARDATFEMRNHLRDRAYERGLDERKQALIESAGWRGQIVLGTRREGDWVLLEVRDNGIGMSEEVRARCHHPHFSTKRDNALHESNSTGMGLGLSFVAVILEHHQAQMQIESRRLEGTLFRIRFAAVPGRMASTMNPVRK